MQFTKTNESEWHDWFAWFPISISGMYVWNEKVKRRRTFVEIPQDCMYGNPFQWEYEFPRNIK